jgi:hypothetical protein
MYRRFPFGFEGIPLFLRSEKPSNDTNLTVGLATLVDIDSKHRQIINVFCPGVGMRERSSAGPRIAWPRFLPFWGMSGYGLVSESPL